MSDSTVVGECDFGAAHSCGEVALNVQQVMDPYPDEEAHECWISYSMDRAKNGAITAC